MLILKIILGVAINIAIFAAVLFVPAGTVSWHRGWVFLGILFCGCAASIFCLRGRQDLLRERMKGPIQKGQPLADKILTPLFVASFFGMIAFTAADVFHWHLLGSPGRALSMLGFAMFAAAWVVEYLALRENAFASSVVRHQEERGQTLVDTGVYSIVRHPMYSGALPLLIGIPLGLGSYAGVAVALAPCLMLAGRVIIEEGMLRRELAGYEDYTRRVRYRLIPYVW